MWKKWNSMIASACGQKSQTNRSTDLIMTSRVESLLSKKRITPSQQKKPQESTSQQSQPRAKISLNYGLIYKEACTKLDDKIVWTYYQLPRINESILGHDDVFIYDIILTPTKLIKSKQSSQPTPTHAFARQHCYSWDVVAIFDVFALFPKRFMREVLSTNVGTTVVWSAPDCIH